MLAEKFMLRLETFRKGQLDRSQMHTDGSPRVASASPHIPVKLPTSQPTGNLRATSQANLRGAPSDSSRAMSTAPAPPSRGRSSHGPHAVAEVSLAPRRSGFSQTQIGGIMGLEHQVPRIHIWIVDQGEG
jgi:hypothetical protein